MKKQFSFFIGCSLLFGACKPSSAGDSNATYTTPPAAGELIASGKTETSDELNHFSFSVFVKAGEFSNKGTYDITAVYGHDTANSQFTMPRGGEHLRPLLKKSAEPSTFIVGFHSGDDTTFYDYYEVSHANGAISMRYLKAYSFK